MIFADTDVTVFVARDMDGALSGVWTIRQFEGQEELLASDPEVVAFRTPPVSAAVLRQIEDLERQELLPRVTREFTLQAGISMILLAQGTSPLQATQAQIAAVVAALANPSHPLYNIGYVKLKAFDDRIAALRAQL